MSNTSKNQAKRKVRKTRASVLETRRRGSNQKSDEEHDSPRSERECSPSPKDAQTEDYLVLYCGKRVDTTEGMGSRSSKAGTGRRGASRGPSSTASPVGVNLKAEEEQKPSSDERGHVGLKVNLAANSSGQSSEGTPTTDITQRVRRNHEPTTGRRKKHRGEGELGDGRYENRVSAALGLVRKKHRDEVGKGQVLSRWDVASFAKFGLGHMMSTSPRDASHIHGLERRALEDDTDPVAKTVEAIVAAALEKHAGQASTAGPQQTVTNIAACRVSYRKATHHTAPRRSPRQGRSVACRQQKPSAIPCSGSVKTTARVGVPPELPDTGYPGFVSNGPSRPSAGGQAVCGLHRALSVLYFSVLATRRGRQRESIYFVMMLGISPCRLPCPSPAGDHVRVRSVVQGRGCRIRGRPAHGRGASSSPRGRASR